jgi:nucleotide-binding universal stress UspA family protein
MISARQHSVLEKPDSGRREPVYRTIIVPLRDDPESLLAVPSACALAATDGGLLVGVFVIEVPSALPLAAHMFEAEGHARDALERARAAAEAYGLRFSGRIVRTHGAAEAIVAEAERLGADLIVVVARRRLLRGPHAPVFDEVVRTLLAQAPCRVSVIAPPQTN